MDYIYTARTKTGAILKDMMSAANQRAVADALRAQGMVVTSIKLHNARIDFASFWDLVRPIKLLDKITFIKNLSVMLRAGLPASRCLRILAAQTTNPRFTKIVTQISKEVESGTSLADSIEHYPGVFSPIFVSMVRVGEISGALEQNLNYLADQMQRDYDLMTKARGAMTYPIIVLVALTIVGFLMFTFVLPKLTSTFKDFQVELPILTQVVIGVVDVFASWGVLILALLVAAAFGFLYWRKTASGKAVIHKAVFYIPIAAGIITKINQARFVRVLS